MNVPSVSVVILSRNRSRELGIVLEHTKSLNLPATCLETIVVDNGSTDGTQSFLSEQHGVRSILNKENVGIAGWNNGFDAAGGKWLLALDDDCYLESDGLGTALQAAADEKADLVSFLVRDPARPAFVFNRLYNTGLLSFWGCAVLVSRRVIQAIGGFDRSILVWGHELEFMLRFFDAGFRHLYLPAVTAFHMNRPAYSDYKYLTNHRHMGYIAGARLPGIAALRALAALFVPIADGFGLRPLAPLYRQLAHATVSGFINGRRRHYRPVRPAVAQVYVRHFAEFSLPLRIRPALRLAWPDHRQYFPALLERASLRLVGATEA
jgi:glycosyltransferase involved in cell wall biosynthesis